MLHGLRQGPSALVPAVERDVLAASHSVGSAASSPAQEQRVPDLLEALHQVCCVLVLHVVRQAGVTKAAQLLHSLLCQVADQLRTGIAV